MSDIAKARREGRIRRHRRVRKKIHGTAERPRLAVYRSNKHLSVQVIDDDESQALAWVLQRANERYATDYPVSVGSHMTNTDSGSFQDFVASISVRENERGTQIGSGWDPHWHQPTDVFTTFSDKDFRLGLNAAQTTLSAIAELVGATLRH